MKGVKWESVSVDPSQLVLRDMLQCRDMTIIEDDVSRVAQRHKTQEQVQLILNDLENGGTINTPPKVCRLNGELLVVDGFHRTMACHKYLKNNPDKNLEIRVELTEVAMLSHAYMLALRANRDHGVGLSTTERNQNGFKQLLFIGGEVKSKREIASETGCSYISSEHLKPVKRQRWRE